MIKSAIVPFMAYGVTAGNKSRGIAVRQSCRDLRPGRPDRVFLSKSDSYTLNRGKIARRFSSIGTASV